MRLTMRTNLAMRTLMFCAVNPGRTVRKAEIASYCNASENHLGLVEPIVGKGVAFAGLHGLGRIALGDRREGARGRLAAGEEQGANRRRSQQDKGLAHALYDGRLTGAG